MVMVHHNPAAHSGQDQDPLLQPSPAASEAEVNWAPGVAPAEPSVAGVETSSRGANRPENAGAMGLTVDDIMLGGMAHQGASGGIEREQGVTNSLSDPADKAIFDREHALSRHVCIKC